MAMLFITHDLNVVRRIADDVIVMQQGRDRRGRAGRPRCSPTRSIPIRGRCSPPSRRATPPPRRSERADDREHGQSQSLVPDPARPLPPHRRARQGGRRRVARGARGPDARRRRRIRLRQDDARPRDAEADPLRRARSPIAGARSTGSTPRQMRPLRRDMQIVFQDPFGSLSPRMSVAEIVEEGLIAQRTPAQRGASGATRRRARARRHRARSRRRWTATRTNSPAASASASPSPARWRSIRNSSCSTSRPRRSTCRSRRRSSISCANCRSGAQLAYLFISHDLKVVRALASEIIVMRRGKVVESGAARAVFAAPQSDYTRALFAAAFSNEATLTAPSASEERQHGARDPHRPQFGRLRRRGGRRAYGDEGADTLGHIAEACALGRGNRDGLRRGPLSLPSLDALGLGHAMRGFDRPRAAGLRDERPARTVGLRRRDLARQGHALGPLGDRRHAGRFRLGLFSRTDPRLPGVAHRGADRGRRAPRHSRQPPRLGHDDHRGASARSTCGR